MTWLLLVLGVIGFVEILLRTTFSDRIGAWFRVMGKAGKVFSSKSISDHWKERVLLVYARQTLGHSLVLLLLILAACLPLALATACAALLELSFLPTLLSPAGFLLATGVAVVHVWIRRHVGG